MNIDKRGKELIARLKDKEHRDAFVSADIDVGISFQIRAIREQRGWTQKELADHAGKKQPWIAKLESPYGGFSLQTLKELASVFDVGLLVRFVPISELVERELTLSPKSLTPVSFDQDPYFQPPITNILGQGGVTIGGEGIIKWTYPSEQPQILQPPQAKPRDELAKLREARQNKAKSQLAELMVGMEKGNATAFG